MFLAGDSGVASHVSKPTCGGCVYESGQRGENGPNIAASQPKQDSRSFFYRIVMQIGVETSRAVENKRVFIVSDDEITRAALQFMLHDEFAAHDLADLGAAYANAIDWKPDLLLLGLEIVEAQGALLLQEIAEKLPGVKIMLIAAPGQDALAQTYLTKGAHSVLTKPLTVEGVRRKVGIVLGQGTNAMVQLSIVPSKKG